MKGLSALFGENPHDKRVKTTAAMMPQSGLAKPALAYVAGRDLGKGEEWDKERNETAMSLYKGNMQMDHADKILANVIKISKQDPKAATAILQREAQDNPALAKFAGISFSGTTTKENWATVKAGDGQAYQVYLPGLMEIQKNPNDKAAFDKYVIPIGIPKPHSDTEGGKPTATTKEWKLNNEQRRTRGEGELSWEEYKEWLSDLDDPTGVKKEMRDESKTDTAVNNAGKRKPDENIQDWINRVGDNLFSKGKGF
jgi:hypothetical protein